MSGTTSGSGVPAAVVSGQGRRDLRLVCLGVAGMTTATALVGLSVALHLRPVGSLAVAAGLAATILPAATGALWAGPLVDRHRTRPLVALAAVISSLALVAAALTALAEGRTVLLLGLAMVTGAAVAVISPALAALVPALVGEEAATRGYGSYGAARSVGTLAGFALGGVLAEGLGVRATLLIGAGSLAGLAAVVLTVRGDRRPAAPGQGLDRSATAGLRLVGRDLVLRIAVAGMALVFVGAVMVDVAAVFFVLEVVPGGTATVFGLTAAAWGAGALVGARLAGRLTGTRALLRALGAAHAVMAAALVLCGLVPSVIVLLSTWLVGGMANGAQNVSVQALVRARSEPHLRGRAFSATSSVFQTSIALGVGAGAVAVPLFGAQGAVIASGIPAVVAALIMLVVTRRPLTLSPLRA